MATRCCSARPARSASRPRSTPSLGSIRSSLSRRSPACRCCRTSWWCRPRVPAKTVQEFVAYAKANPGKLNYGAGLGTPPHLLGDAVQEQGRNRHHLHSLQGRGAVGDRPARRADAFHHRRHADPDAAHQGRKAPRARASARPQRWHGLPDVPTMTESGFPISPSTPGPAWSRLPARRRRSSRSLTAR